MMHLRKEYQTQQIAAHDKELGNAASNSQRETANYE
jgi:hypothetical protein